MDQILRVAKSVVFFYRDEAFIANNFFVGQEAVVSNTSLRVLSLCQCWTPRDDIISGLPDEEQVAVRCDIDRLLDRSIIVARDSSRAYEDERFGREWIWGLVPGLFHFSIKDTKYSDPNTATSWLIEHAAHVPPVPLLQTNAGRDAVIPIGRPVPSGVLGSLYRRRSYRGFSAAPLPAAALSRCLFAGTGITAIGKTGIAGHDDIPLKTSPSAGGRNPFEAFVYVRNVAGLLPGYYHYCGLDGTLGLIRPESGDLSAGDLLAGQPWFDGAAAVIFLVAYFERTMWKYPHPSAYRVVLLEAGHIAQNILLVAAEQELAAAPTSAITDQEVETRFGLDRTMNAALYAVAVGVADPSPSQADIPRVVYLPQ